MTITQRLAQKQQQPPRSNVVFLYVDGGCIGANPTKIGGTWAYVALGDQGQKLFEAHGALEPADLGIELVTNNIMELYAAVRALERVGGRGWDGTLHTDSEVTLCRLQGGQSFQNVPKTLVERTLEVRNGRRWKGQLVKGHPTWEDLQRGKNKKGRPVSPWNVRCDELCQAAARRLLRIKLQPVLGGSLEE